ncbi:fez family zinc finger protein 2-like isoform X2 [Drosophila innubila]|nr:fez family zinc finger protein 2-like isoform X2 [Drosophila innubila]
MCQHAGCSFSTLRWDNLNRHIQRVHGVTKPRNENAEELKKEVIKVKPLHLEDPSSAVMDDEDLALIQSDEDPASMLSDEESASLLSDEIPTVFPAEDPSETIPTKNQTDVPKLNKVSKQKDKRIVKPRKNYKSGKSKFYECETCSYRTNRGYNIKRHIAKHGSTELELHVCVISGCGFSTPRWDNLCRHVKRVHSETATPTGDYW